MLERETIQPQSEGTKSEAEKAAEEERRATQAILEKLYDPLTENDWLVHYTPDFHTLNSILGRGILSKTYADTARELRDNTIPDIIRHDISTQPQQNISALHKNLNNPRHIPFLWVLGNNPEKTGIMFTPLKNAPLFSGSWDHEIQVRFKVARRRFKMLVVREPNSYTHESENKFAKDGIEELKTRAQKHNLPIIDNCYNLLYPLELPANALREITIPRLRILAKMLGIEKLRAMSVEEIKSVAKSTPD